MPAHGDMAMPVWQQVRIAAVRAAAAGRALVAARAVVAVRGLTPAWCGDDV